EQRGLRLVQRRLGQLFLFFFDSVGQRRSVLGIQRLPQLYGGQNKFLESLSDLPNFRGGGFVGGQISFRILFFHCLKPKRQVRSLVRGSGAQIIHPSLQGEAVQVKLFSGLLGRGFGFALSLVQKL